MPFVIENPAGDFQEIVPEPFKGIGDRPVLWAATADTPILQLAVGSPPPSVRPPWPPPPLSSGLEWLVIHSGYIPDDDDDAPTTPPAPDPRTWGPRGWAMLEERLADLLSRPGPRFLVRPRWSDVISDAPSCCRFLELAERHASTPPRLGILLDPVAMLAPSMMTNAEDHVRRVIEIVAHRPGVEGVVFSNVELHDGLPRPSPVHRGLLDVKLLAALARSLPQLPIVLSHEQMLQQQHALMTM